MKTGLLSLWSASLMAVFASVHAQQAPWSTKNTPISHHDRVYAAEQFSNTVSVTDPVDNKLLGTIRLGDTQPSNFSPLYRGQLLVHGMGFAPDGHTLAVVSIGSNAVSFIDTQTNTVKRTTYVGRSPHEAFFTPDGKKVWVTVRGEDYISVLDAVTFEETSRIKTPGGPGMTTFSPDGKYAYICSSFNPVTVVFDVQTQTQVGQVTQPSPFCPNIAASPDGTQVWFTLKDVGKVVAFEAKPPFHVLGTFDTGPITNHVNFAVTKQGQLAYVTVGGLDQVKVFRTSDFALITTIPVGALPHGVWPSGDGRRIYVGLENDDKLAVIDTTSQKVVTNIDIGQAPQAVAYVVNAVSDIGVPGANLQPLGVAGSVAKLSLSDINGSDRAVTRVTLFDQGLVQVLQASATHLQPGQTYVVALAAQADGGGALQALASFKANAAGAAIVNASGPIRQLVTADASDNRRWLVIAEVHDGKSASVIQRQDPEAQ